MKEKWQNKYYLLMDAATDTGGSGGGGGSALTAPTGGSGSAAAAGSTNSASGTNNNQQAAANANAGNAAAGGTASDWRSQLPTELQENVTLKKYDSVSTLAGAYLNAQKLIGADKIVVPNENTTEEQWTEIYRKLGSPEALDKYDVKFQEGASLDKKFTDEFKSLAHKSGILPKQAQALADWFSTINKGSEAELLAQRQAAVTKGLGDLKTEWGTAYDQNLARAKKVVNSLGDKKLLDFLDNSGAGDDPAIIKLFAKVGQTLWGEDSLVGESGGGSSVMTPAEAKEATNKIMADMKHPYHLKDHPGHKAAVAEVQQLFKSMYAGS